MPIVAEANEASGIELSIDNQPDKPLFQLSGADIDPNGLLLSVLSSSKDLMYDSLVTGILSGARRTLVPLFMIQGPQQVLTCEDLLNQPYYLFYSSPPLLKFAKESRPFSTLDVGLYGYADRISREETCSWLSGMVTFLVKTPLN